VPRAAALRRTPTGRGEAAPTRFSGQHLAWVSERIARQSDDPLIGFHMRFEVAEGNYRLVAAFDFRRQIAFVNFIGTHAEYDRIDALTASQF
jgi:HigB_toxin, RelE-like toxic component of a toxin-antitoxin system